MNFEMIIIFIPVVIITITAVIIRRKKDKRYYNDRMKDIESGLEKCKDIESQLNEPNEDIGKVKINEIGDIFNKVINLKKEHSFVVFIFELKQKRYTENILNIQFSYEKGRIGLDWLLTTEAAIGELQSFISLLKKYKYEYIKHNEGDCEFIRIEEGDLVKLALHIFTELFRFDVEEEVEVFKEL